MSNEPAVVKTDSALKLAVVALCFALAVAVFGLVYTATTQPPAHNVIDGKLEVSYMLITSRTASSEEASGSTIAASRVEYFQDYVLVTKRDGVTVLWPIDRLKKLEVSQVDAAKLAQGQ